MTSIVAEPAASVINTEECSTLKMHAVGSFRILVPVYRTAEQQL